MHEYRDPDVFAGSAFHTMLPGGRAAGSIRLCNSALRFETEIQPQQPLSAEVSSEAASESQPALVRVAAQPQHVQFEIPYTGMKVAMGGAANRIIFFSHPSQPELSIFTSDHLILRNERLALYPQVQEQLKKIGSTKRTGRMVLWAVMLLLSALILTPVLMKDMMVSALARQVPVSAEEKLGDTVFQHVSVGKKFIDDPEIVKQLEEMAQPLLDAIPEKRYNFKLHIIRDSSINAFALPGGNIVIHSGLLEAANGPEEVLGVLAHEIAHVTERHGLRQMIQSAGLLIIVQSFLGDLPGLWAFIANNGAVLITHKFSRDHERDADDRGLLYLTEADIDPRGLMTFFQKLQDEQKKMLETLGANEEALALISTHPATEERISTLKKKIDALPQKSYRNFDIDFKAFQDKVRTFKK